MKILSDRYVFKKAYVRLLVWIFDLVGSGCFFWLRWFKTKQPVKRILIVRLDQIGDVVLTLPVIDLLKACFPEVKIDFLVSPAAQELVENHPDISCVYTFQNAYFSKPYRGVQALCEWFQYLGLFRRNRYDLAFDFRGDVRNAFLLFLSGAKRRVGRGSAGGGFLFTDLVAERSQEHQLERNLALLRVVGCATAETDSGVYYPPGTLGIFKARHPDLFSKGIHPWIVIHIGSGYPSKRWPVSNFFLLIDRILKSGMGSVLLIGQGSEERLAGSYFKENPHLFNLMSKTTLSELCALIDACDLFIGNDSGPTHIAAALGKKVVALFSGTNDYRVWQPRGRSVHILHHPVPCSPCHEKICPLPRHDCMEAITVEQVFEKVRTLIHE